MADPDADTIDPPKDGKPGKLLEGKSQAKREKILVVSGVGVLILTVLILRKQSAANAANAANANVPAYSANPTPGTATDSTTAVDPATGVPYAQELAAAQQQSLGMTVSSLPSTGTTGVTSAPTLSSSLPTSAPTPISSAPTSSGPSSSSGSGTGGGGGSTGPISITIDNVNGVPSNHPSTSPATHTQPAPGVPA
jgi:hypothetical protein